VRRRGARFSIAGRVAHAALSTLLHTVRVTRIGADHYRPLVAGKGCIFVLWHGRLLVPAYLHRHEGHATLVSRSADGEYLSRLLVHWGYYPVRGSSSRGGMAAVRELTRAARLRRSLVITPDGPRGPREVLKDGPLYVARLSGLPIVPVAASARRAWWVEGWDRFQVPQPFSRVVIEYGEPFDVEPDADAAQLGARRDALQAVLEELVQRVDRAVA
jgi:lysophospholipid acyltransferase (LPLAT)-like uncharacterized protein